MIVDKGWITKDEVCAGVKPEIDAVLQVRLTVFQWSETKDGRAVRKAARLSVADAARRRSRRRKAEDRGGSMTSAAPSATSAAPNEPAIRRLLSATEIDTRMIGMIGALALIWVGFNVYTLVQTGEGLFLTPAQSLEFERPDVVDRDHGDGHGAHHRHAPYRPFGRIDHRLRLDHHRRGAGPYSAGLSRPRQSGDLDHRRRHRARRSARRSAPFTARSSPMSAFRPSSSPSAGNCSGAAPPGG